MIQTPAHQDLSPLSRALRACRVHFWGAAVFSALANLLFITPTLYLMQVYDRVLPTGGQVTLLLLSGLTVVALAVQAFLDWMRARILVRAGARLDEQLAGATVSAVLSGRGEGAGRGQVVRDFDTLRQTLAGAGLIAMLDLPWAPFYLFLTFVLHPALGVLALVGGIIIFALALVNERSTRAGMKQANESSNRSYATLDAAAQSPDTVRGLGMGKAMTVKHLQERAQMIDLQSRASFTGAFYTSLIKGFRIFMQSASVGLGAYLVLHGQMSGGAVMASSFLLSRALAPIEQITGAWPALDRARNAFASLKALFERDGVKAPPTRLPRPEGVITVENLSVMTPDGKRTAITDVMLKLQPGMIIGITGSSGSGKSTLGRALVGAVTPEVGVVRIDGAAIADWDAEELARHIGYLPQTFTLYEGTVKENITRFRGYLGDDAGVLDDMAVDAAKAAGVHEMILRLPNGYETRLGAGGSGLSGGQTQRVALARALFGRPRILVLDEPNAHMDGQSEQQLLDTLTAFRGAGSTVVVLAHSRSILSVVDRLVVLSHGKVDVAGSLRDVVNVIRERNLRAAPTGAPAAQPAPAQSAPQPANHSEAPAMYARQVSA